MRIEKHQHSMTHIGSIGPAKDGRTDFFNLSHMDAIELIKEQLTTNFCCNLWTLGWSEEELGTVDDELTSAGIVHCYDEVIDSFVCFNSELDMMEFYDKIRQDASEEKLNFLRRHNYNTPVIKFYE